MMEDIYLYVLETVTKLAKMQFEQFKLNHEIRLNRAPLIAKQINEEALMKVTEEPYLNMDSIFSKEEILEHLTTLDSADLDALAHRKGSYSIIAKEFDLWVSFLISTQKQKYLNLLLEGTSLPPKAFQDFLNPSTDRDQIIDTLSTLVNVGSGKKLAMIVIALEESGILLPYKSLKNLFESMGAIYKNIGTLTGFQDQYKFLKRDSDKDSLKEIDKLLEYFKSLL